MAWYATLCLFSSPLFLKSPRFVSSTLISSLPRHQRTTRRSLNRRRSQHRRRSVWGSYSKERYLIEEKMGMHTYYRSQLACRTDCGEQNPKLYCSKCKIARKSTLLSVWFNTDTLHAGYCTSACQLEDWNILLLTWPTVSQNLLWNGRTYQ